MPFVTRRVADEITGYATGMGKALLPDVFFQALIIAVQTVFKDRSFVTIRR